MAFSAEELAEMARADAEIEASFQLTQDEIILGRKLDSAAALDNMDAERRKVADYQRQYYEANKAKVAERQRQYREANKGCASDGKCAIKLCRLGLGLSQKEFARLVGVTQGAVSCWENVKAPEEWENIIEMVERSVEHRHTGELRGHGDKKAGQARLPVFFAE